MKDINDSINYEVYEGYVRKYLPKRFGEPSGDFKYCFGMNIYKSYVTRDMKLVNKKIPTIVFVYNDGLADICRSLEEGDHILVNAEKEMIDYVLDGEHCRIPEIKATRILKVERKETTV